MSNCYAVYLDAISFRDDTARAQFSSDGMSTMALGLSLMNLQADWSMQLELDRKEFMVASLDPDQAPGAKAKQIIYQTDSSMKDMQCNAMQNTLKSMQSQVQTDSTNRKENMGSGEGVNGSLAYFTALIKQPLK